MHHPGKRPSGQVHKTPSRWKSRAFSAAFVRKGRFCRYCARTGFRFVLQQFPGRTTGSRSQPAGAPRSRRPIGKHPLSHPQCGARQPKPGDLKHARQEVSRSDKKARDTGLLRLPINNWLGSPRSSLTNPTLIAISRQLAMLTSLRFPASSMSARAAFLNRGSSQKNHTAWRVRRGADSSFRILAKLLQRGVEILVVSTSNSSRVTRGYANQFCPTSPHCGSITGAFPEKSRVERPRCDFGRAWQRMRNASHSVRSRSRNPFAIPAPIDPRQLRTCAKPSTWSSLENCSPAMNSTGRNHPHESGITLSSRRGQRCRHTAGPAPASCPASRRLRTWVAKHSRGLLENDFQFL